MCVSKNSCWGHRHESVQLQFGAEELSNSSCSVHVTRKFGCNADTQVPKDWSSLLSNQPMVCISAFPDPFSLSVQTVLLKWAVQQIIGLLKT